ncbi:MAG: hypothetical protein U0132_10745 [Gemmatimonadaceae bacterium]
MKNFFVIMLVLGMHGAVSHRAAAQVERPPHRRDREALQQRFQERFAQAVREGVGLSDEQMPKLLELNRRFEGRRRELLLHERDVRIGLRDELAPGATPNEEAVRKLLDDQMRVQRDRLQLMEEEQQALAGFMTPSQRARYFGMQEQMRRKVEQLRGGPPGGPDGEALPLERRRMRREPPDTTVR